MLQAREINLYRLVCLVLIYLALTRLLGMWVMPLNDSTEARYGEIARLMLESHNWVTPMQTLGEPFWAKPPLSTWLSAGCMKLFGVHACAARMHALFLSIAALGCIGQLAYRRYGVNLAGMALLILAGSPYFYIDAGVVMTDPALLFSMTLSMVSAWLAIKDNQTFFGYLFFVGLGLGLLAKGPLVAVLVVLPLLLWTVQQRAYQLVWQRLPWFKGGLLMFAIALPWYLLAEIRTPGFLQYFIVGEHVQRFLQPGWQGDKYGFAHATPYGMIWLYLLGGIMPWAVVALFSYKKNHNQTYEKIKKSDGWIQYLLFFALTPLVFFTFSGNIIYTYTFPSLAPLALLFTEGLHRSLFPSMTIKRCAFFASIMGSLFLCVSIIFLWAPEYVAKSQNRMVALGQGQLPKADDILWYWGWHPEYSAQFYANGHIQATHDVSTLRDMIEHKKLKYLAVKLQDLPQIPVALSNTWRSVALVHQIKNQWILFDVMPF